MLRVHPLPAPPHFSEAQRKAWRDIVDDRNFRLTALNLQIAAQAVETLAVLIHTEEQIRSLTRARKVPPRRLYDVQSRSAKAYFAALRGTGVLPP